MDFFLQNHEMNSSTIAQSSLPSLFPTTIKPSTGVTPATTISMLSSEFEGPMILIPAFQATTTVTTFISPLTPMMETLMITPTLIPTTTTSSSENLLSFHTIESQYEGGNEQGEREGERELEPKKEEESEGVEEESLYYMRGRESLIFALPKDSLDLINSIEHLILNLLVQLIGSGNAKIRLINKTKWQNFYVDDSGIMRIRALEPLIYETLEFNHKRRNYRFTLILYTLAEIHKMLLMQGSTSNRELYYKNPLLVGRQNKIDAAIQDVCFLFHKPSHDFGIFPSAKGLVAGDLKIILKNGNILESHKSEGSTFFPPALNSIDSIVTSAKYVLLVEKDTVFRKLISLNILLRNDLILITGKGYPDMCTRYLVQFFSVKCHLPIYALFDADPFGIEIMLTYRHGSRSMAFSGDTLACPQLLWLGVHPSEMNVLPNIPTLPLKQTDLRRISSLMQRNYISAAIHYELSMLLHLQRKAQIEAILDFLVKDYIPNKITRNLII